MNNFYKQDKGLLIPPGGVPKRRVSWTLDNILEGFRHFYKENNRWPIGLEVDKYEYLPCVRIIEKKFGGITNIRKLLGLKQDDYRFGDIRSRKAKEIGKRGFLLEQKVYEILIALFHEPYVHNQSRVVVGDSITSFRVDFNVYHKDGKFAVDVFHPAGDKVRFSNKIAYKYTLYRNFPYKIYLCIGNLDITNSMISINRQVATKRRNKNLILTTYNDFVNKMGEYVPLDDPYKQ